MAEPPALKTRGSLSSLFSEFNQSFDDLGQKLKDTTKTSSPEENFIRGLYSQLLVERNVDWRPFHSAHSIHALYKASQLSIEEERVDTSSAFYRSMIQEEMVSPVTGLSTHIERGISILKPLPTDPNKLIILQKWAYYLGFKIGGYGLQMRDLLPLKTQFMSAFKVEYLREERSLLHAFNEGYVLSCIKSEDLDNAMVMIGDPFDKTFESRDTLPKGKALLAIQSLIKLLIRHKDSLYKGKVGRYLEYWVRSSEVHDWVFDTVIPLLSLDPGEEFVFRGKYGLTSGSLDLEKLIANETLFKGYLVDKNIKAIQQLSINASTMRSFKQKQPPYIRRAVSFFIEKNELSLAYDLLRQFQGDTAVRNQITDDNFRELYDGLIFSLVEACSHDALEAFIKPYSVSVQSTFINKALEQALNLNKTEWFDFFYNKSQSESLKIDCRWVCDLGMHRILEGNLDAVLKWIQELPSGDVAMRNALIKRLIVYGCSMSISAYDFYQVLIDELHEVPVEDKRGLLNNVVFVAINCGDLDIVESWRELKGERLIPENIFHDQGILFHELDVSRSAWDMSNEPRQKGWAESGFEWACFLSSKAAGLTCESVRWGIRYAQRQSRKTK